MFTFDLKGSFYNRRVDHRLNLRGAEEQLSTQKEPAWLYDEVHSPLNRDYRHLRKKASSYFKRITMSHIRERAFFDSLTTCGKCLLDLNFLDLVRELKLYYQVDLVQLELADETALNE